MPKAFFFYIYALMFKKIAEFDERVSRYWFFHRFSPKVDKWLRFYTRLGDGYVWALVIIFIVWNSGISFLGNVLVQVLASLAVSLAAYWAIKLLARRKRPFEVIEGFQALVPPLDKFSFPSGHTMNNLAVASTLFLSVPVAGALMMALPLTWGLLRVYFGVHWLTDVIGGFCLGILSFLLGHLIWLYLLEPHFLCLS